MITLLATFLLGKPSVPEARAQPSLDDVAAATVLIAALVLEVENGIPVREYTTVPLGSGVLVSDEGLILTNRHVVDLTALQNDIQTLENTQGIDLEIEDRFMIYVVDGTGDIPDARYSATKVIDQQNADLAVLKITGDERGLPLRRPISQDRSPVDLAPPGPIGPQDAVHIFGYPVFGNETTADFSAKTIDVVHEQVRSLETGPGFGNILLIHIDATLSGGSSGGAVVNDDGRLVAIVAETREGSTGGSAAVAIPVDRARPLLLEAGWVEPTPEAAPPTNTPVPPTDTPVPPTLTPAPTSTTSPPTNTPLPPTDTPIPTNTPVPPTSTLPPTQTPVPHVAQEPTPPPATREQASSDQERFETALASVEASAPIAGPLQGTLTESTPDEMALAFADVQISSFVASVIFTNPDTSAGLWDAGFGFGSNVIVVDSLGDVYGYFEDRESQEVAVAQRFDASAGARNTLQLVVDGTTVLFGVNGELALTVELDEPYNSDLDVVIGSALFSEDFVQDRVTEFEEFRVWDFVGGIAPIGTPTFQQTIRDDEAELNPAPQTSETNSVPMHRGNLARTGVMPGPGPVGQPVVLWTFSTGGPVVSSPAVSEGVVFVGSYDNVFYALDAATGQQQWQFRTGNAIASSPAVVDGIVFFSSLDGSLYALDAESGTEKWRAPIGGGVSFSSPAVADGSVYVGGSDNAIYAFDVATGTQRWRFESEGTFDSAPAVVNGVVFVGNRDRAIYALDAETGEELWRFVADDHADTDPAVVGDRVFSGSADGMVHSLDTTTGELVWQATVGDGMRSSAAVGNGVVYVATWDGAVVALDAESGAEVWRTNTGGEIESSPALADGVIYVGSNDSHVYAFDAQTGEELWRLATGHQVHSSPAVVGGVVYVGSNDKSIYAIAGSGG